MWNMLFLFWDILMEWMEKGMAAKIFPASVYDLTVTLHREHSLLNVRGYLNAHQEQGCSSPKRVSCEI